MKGLADYLHSKKLKMGCYTAPALKNCCGEPGSLGFEQVDMDFFAEIGCDNVMVDWCRPYHTPLETKNEFDAIGKAIANSSNPNMVYGIWPTGFGKSWNWASEVGGHYWRVETDMSNEWEHGHPPSQPGSVLHNFDMAMSIPGIQSHTVPGRYTFLDTMVVGVQPGGSAVSGKGLTIEEQRSHMTLWVMAASPLLTSVDVRKMSAEVKEILTNEEVLAVHKDPLVKMGVRIDVGGGVNEIHTASASLWSAYAKPLVDGSTAVMVLNRAATNQTMHVALEDIGDPYVTHYAIRDMWARKNLSSVPTMAQMGYQTFNIVPTLLLTVPAHGVRFLRMWPLPPAPTPAPSPPATPPPPIPPPACPSGFNSHAAGYWHNPFPCGLSSGANCTEDTTNITAPLCAQKCKSFGTCVGFEIYSKLACWLFLGKLQEPFHSDPAAFTCTVV
jgi:alpha-galactosidase